ncbi:MAG: 7,8-dihydro-8-oxoguanine triphosphatase [Desulfobulbaceae bacterium A2]|nr:MAG: 7,8-dihydro-8-oxoguanine triphosphatase [Desulfobulbaceae bacterium A2]
MYRPILGTLGYVLSPDRQQVLLVHRNQRPDDAHLGKYNGLGGKMLPDEDALACLCRELREEAGIVCCQVRLRGTINWQGFGRGGEDWFGFIFLVEQFTGTPYERNAEGELGWHPLTALSLLPMWEGDRHFLPLVFDNDPRPFHGHLPYRDGRPVSWHVQRL